MVAQARVRVNMAIPTVQSAVLIDWDTQSYFESRGEQGHEETHCGGRQQKPRGVWFLKCFGISRDSYTSANSGTRNLAVGAVECFL
jgi:hypothetical protein